ncbi:DEAD/DEAH box helicase [Nesterenkonia ebinurensis]|uniref:DEAD/DEAH box helicase n=1 Tax=Nesterenkonia ebinurensis TaxID=2608252 RepID=UPI00123D8419|nr:DEAD/DEAH box helicase [Nesterenkonia ebinurensis]
MAALARLEVPGSWGTPSPEQLFEAFTSWVESRGMQLYPAQEDAVAELAEGHHVIMATPTGSGKSMVALAAHFFALARGERTVYTAPIKALVSEKFFSLVEVFGPDKVGMITGDSSVNAGAPIICCTAEILANEALRDGAEADLGPVVMDEFHFYADPHRGWAWQVPLIELGGQGGQQSTAQFLLMSATLGDTSRFEARIAERTGRDVVVVSSAQRPVPLSFEYSTTPLVEKLQELAENKLAPVYVVHFSQRAATEQAAGLMSLNLLSKAEREQLGEKLRSFRFAKGYGQTLARLLKSGVGVHHAGMLPKYRRLVEQLAQQGLLKVISGTDTLGVGINVPIRTVLLTGLSKYDGTRVRQLNAREFHQIAGRAGRAGFDTEGTVVVQAPEHVIENLAAERKLAAKHSGDEAKLAQALKSKPKKKPLEGFVSWSEKTFERLIEAEPEPMTSKMQVTYAMVLHLLNRPEDPVRAMRRLITSSDESGPRQAILQRRALDILRELLAAGVLERLDEPDADGRTVDLTIDLQDDFALNQPLAPFAVAALELLDPDSETYALDVISVIEAILDTPYQVTGAQVKKIKSERLAELKAEGVDYTERMRILDELTHPQPLAELLEQQFEIYRTAAPWVADQGLAPKSVVRDMVERAFTFIDAVNFYGLARSEGVLLRYLTDAYRALRQTVPAGKVSEELEDLIEWLGEVIRQTDSSLLEEWERLAAEDDPAKLAELERKQQENDAAGAPVSGFTSNERAFAVVVRNAMFRRAELLAREKEGALAALEREHAPGSEWADPERWSQVLDAFFDEYQDVYVDAKARSAEYFRLEKNPAERPGFWHAVQVLDDDQGNHDWGIRAWVDLAASDEAEAAVIAVHHVGEL